MQMQKHRHFVGKAQSFEIVQPDDDKYQGENVTVLKTFFIDDTVNENDWQATWEGLKKDVKLLIGVPLVMQEDLEHPEFSIQEFYDRGTIFDYEIDEENKKIIVYIIITDKKIIERIKNGELEFVSPAVIPKSEKHWKTVDGVDILDRTTPIHLAIVGEPAYNKHKALMTHLCTGPGDECYHRLQMMTASKHIYKSADECVSKKIQIIKDERPGISNTQAAAMAYSMCRKNKESKKGDYTSQITALEQIPLLKKMTAKLVKIGSVIEQKRFGMKYPIVDGKEGRWITAKNQDVFVARNQPIDEAIKNQCGCSLL